MSEEIRKSFSGGTIKADAAADIDLINRYTLKELKPEEVFAFNVNLCDDQPDRDNECFNLRSLRKLASLFPGRPLIQDHEWSANNQQGRIYRAQVVQDGKVNRLRASVYMVRTSGTEETIAQIEGGVLREVSIGFAIKNLTCSICGKPMIRSWAGFAKCENDHEKGKDYNGQTCLGIMEDPSDAFEVSFVAVPSQREAGVTKGRQADQQISPEELQRRKEILLENERFLAKFQASENKPERKDYEDFVPYDDCSPGNILFAMIPVDAIPENVKHAAYEALGFCRKELAMQRIDTKWFATIEYAERLGFKWDELKKFRYMPNIVGMASRKNPNQILVRYPQSIQDIQKTIFHEVWHTFQMKYANNPLMEENAYWYMDDAYKRFMALSAEEKRSLYWYSHT